MQKPLPTKQDAKSNCARHDSFEEWNGRFNFLGGPMLAVLRLPREID